MTVTVTVFVSFVLLACFVFLLVTVSGRVTVSRATVG